MSNIRNHIVSYLAENPHVDPKQTLEGLKELSYAIGDKWYNNEETLFDFEDKEHRSISKCNFISKIAEVTGYSEDKIGDAAGLLFDVLNENRDEGSTRLSYSEIDVLFEGDRDVVGTFSLWDNLTSIDDSETRKSIIKEVQAINQKDNLKELLKNEQVSDDVLKNDYGSELVEEIKTELEFEKFKNNDLYPEFSFDFEILSMQIQDLNSGTMTLGYLKNFYTDEEVHKIAEIYKDVYGEYPSTYVELKDNKSDGINDAADTSSGATGGVKNQNELSPDSNLVDSNVSSHIQDLNSGTMTLDYLKNFYTDEEVHKIAEIYKDVYGEYPSTYVELKDNKSDGINDSEIYKDVPTYEVQDGDPMGIVSVMKDLNQLDNPTEPDGLGPNDGVVITGTELEKANIDDGAIPDCSRNFIKNVLCAKNDQEAKNYFMNQFGNRYNDESIAKVLCNVQPWIESKYSFGNPISWIQRLADEYANVSVSDSDPDLATQILESVTNSAIKGDKNALEILSKSIFSDPEYPLLTDVLKSCNKNPVLFSNLKEYDEDFPSKILDFVSFSENVNLENIELLFSIDTFSDNDKKEFVSKLCSSDSGKWFYEGIYNAYSDEPEKITGFLDLVLPYVDVEKLGSESVLNMVAHSLTGKNLKWCLSHLHIEKGSEFLNYLFSLVKETKEEKQEEILFQHLISYIVDKKHSFTDFLTEEMNNIYHEKFVKAKT